MAKPTVHSTPSTLAGTKDEVLDFESLGLEISRLRAPEITPPDAGLGLDLAPETLGLLSHYQSTLGGSWAAPALPDLVPQIALRSPLNFSISLAGFVSLGYPLNILKDQEGFDALPLADLWSLGVKISGQTNLPVVQAMVPEALYISGEYHETAGLNMNLYSVAVGGIANLNLTAVYDLITAAYPQAAPILEEMKAKGVPLPVMAINELAVMDGRYIVNNKNVVTRTVTVTQDVETIVNHQVVVTPTAVEVTQHVVQVRYLHGAGMGVAITVHLPNTEELITITSLSDLYDATLVYQPNEINVSTLLT